MIPTLTTGRLILRPLEEADLEAWVALTADPGVHRNLGSFPSFFSTLHAEMRLMVARAAHALGRLTNFGVEHDGAFIGTIGLSHPAEDAQIGGTHHRAGRSNLGYGFARSTWGRGIATEAVQAVLEWAEAAIVPEAYVASYFLDNPASGRVLEKMGFVNDGEPELHFCMGRMENAMAQNMILHRTTLQTLPRTRQAQAA